MMLALFFIAIIITPSEAAVGAVVPAITALSTIGSGAATGGVGVASATAGAATGISLKTILVKLGIAAAHPRTTFRSIGAYILKHPSLIITNVGLAGGGVIIGTIIDALNNAQDEGKCFRCIQTKM